MTTPPGDQPPSGDYPPQQPDQQYPQGPPPGQAGYPPYQQPYQQPYAPYGYPAAPPDHPRATTAMVLGILGLVMCQIAAPFAWSIGKRTLAEIDASGGRLGGRGQAQTGYVLGIVGTALLGLAVVFLAIYFVVVVVAIGASVSST